MADELERIIRKVYREWKSAQREKGGAHPDEETFVSFLENRLSRQEDERVKSHIIACDKCAGVLYLELKSMALEEKDIPAELLEKTMRKVSEMLKGDILEIILRLGRETLEIINTTGDVLVGQELIPAAVLRSRRIKDFKDQINVLKDFKAIMVEIKIERKESRAIDLCVTAKMKETREMIKGMRVTLFKDDLELESYLSDSGKVTFEHISSGKYVIELSSGQDKLATVVLDISA